MYSVFGLVNNISLRLFALFLKYNIESLDYSDNMLTFAREFER